MKQYKKCGNCRAYLSNRCTLGFKTETIFFGGIGGIPIGAKPLEPCPKPTTYDTLLKAYKEQNKTNQS